jgi:hypothetical protein
VQHGVALDFVDLGHGADVSGNAGVGLDGVLALQQEQMADLERLAAVPGEQLGVARNRSLVNAEHRQLADEGVDHHLEYVGQHMP